MRSCCGSTVPGGSPLAADIVWRAGELAKEGGQALHRLDVGRRRVGWLLRGDRCRRRRRLACEHHGFDRRLHAATGDRRRPGQARHRLRIVDARAPCRSAGYVATALRWAAAPDSRKRSSRSTSSSSRRVAQGREMSRDAVHDVAQGRVWTGAAGCGGRARRRARRPAYGGHRGQEATSGPRRRRRRHARALPAAPDAGGTAGRGVAGRACRADSRGSEPGRERWLDVRQLARRARGRDTGRTAARSPSRSSDTAAVRAGRDVRREAAPRLRGFRRRAGRCTWRKQFVANRPHGEAVEIASREDTLTGLFPESKTEVVETDGNLRTVGVALHGARSRGQRDVPLHL